jgi:hypothetical protein
VEQSNHPFAIRLWVGPLEKIETVTPAGKPYILRNLPYFPAGKIEDYINDFVKSWFMPRAAAYEQRSGGEPDTLFQTLSKHFGGNGRQFGV